MTAPFRRPEEELSVAPAGRLICLVKVGERDNLEKLARGDLRFTRLGIYRDYESKGEAHHDANEGIAAIFQSDSIRMILKAGDEEFEVSQETGLLDQVR